MLSTSFPGRGFLVALSLVALSGCATLEPKAKVAVPVEPPPVRVEEAAPPPVQEPQPELIVPRFPDQDQNGAQQAPDFADDEQFQSHVRGRLTVFEQRLVEWRDTDVRMSVMDIEEERPQRWRQCLAQIEKVYNTYALLDQQMSRADNLYAGLRVAERDIIEAGWQDIAYLESGCEAAFRTARAAVSGAPGREEADFSAAELEGRIGHYSARGMHREVLAGYVELAGKFPDHEPAPSIHEAYTTALLATGKIEAADRALRRLVAGSNHDMNLWPLRRLYADFLVSAGRLAEAREQYHRLASFFDSLKVNDFWVADQLSLLDAVLDPGQGDFRLFADFMRQVLLFDGRQVSPQIRQGAQQLAERYPASQMTVRADQILRQIEEEASSWVGRQLIAADILVEKKEFQRAKTILDGLLRSELSDEVRDIVQRAMDDVVLVENLQRESEQTLLQEEQEGRWAEGERLLDMNMYDEAIAVYASLLNTGYDVKARMKIAEAANSAAKKARNEAAQLFLKARNAAGPEQKKEYMLESWRLLRQIVLKYPETELIDKVRKNLFDVETQIREIDPSLLESDESYEKTW